MEEHDKIHFQLLGAGLLLGISADLLLRATPWGVNILIWIIAFIVFTIVLEMRIGFGLPPRLLWLVLPACFFAGAFAWRDSKTLMIANGLGLFCVMALAALRNRSGCLAFGWVTEYSFGLLRPWLSAPISYLKMSSSALGGLWTMKRQFTGTPVAVLRGIALALPLLLIFGALFIRADAAFESFVTGLITFDISGYIPMLLWLPVCVLIGGGILLNILSLPESTEMKYKKCGCSLGRIETAIILGLMNMLFFTFIATQFSHFFGGIATLAAVADLSMAEYARRGFFELVTVSLLLLPLLLGLHWLWENDSKRRTDLVTILCTSLVLMLFAIMASAMHRMYLYQETFGLTELRVYASAAMAWIAMVFVWFLITVLFGNRTRFAFGALVAGFTVIAILDLISPDALIVKVNTTRYHRCRPVDVNYLVSLSADAVPALVAALPSLDKQTYSSTMMQLTCKAYMMKSHDWRSWNLSRQRAAALGTPQSAPLSGGMNSGDLLQEVK